jgi:hypothetical protein
VWLENDTQECQPAHMPEKQPPLLEPVLRHCTANYEAFDIKHEYKYSAINMHANGEHWRRRQSLTYSRISQYFMEPEPKTPPFVPVLSHVNPVHTTLFL